MGDNEDDDKGMSGTTVIALAVAGMALAVSVALAYYVTKPQRNPGPVAPSPGEQAGGG